MPPTLVISAIAATLVVAIAIWLIIRFRASREKYDHPMLQPQSVGANKDESVLELERQLLNISFGDREKLERLVNHEQEASPHLTRGAAMKAAIERHNNDNRGYR